MLAFTAVLGRLITLPAPLLVMWRTGLAALLMAGMLAVSNRRALTMARSDVAKTLAIGLILGLHWITFFGSIQLSNISICLTGMASTSFFTALSEPLVEKRKPCIKEVLLGLMVIPGLCLVAGASWDHLPGLICALASAMFASLYPVFNRKLTLRGLSPSGMTLYELISACAICGLTAMVASGVSLTQLPEPMDSLWLLILSGVCTVWAFSFHIRLLKQFTAFTSNLVINFEPVYGILLAAVLFKEHHELSGMFYVGALFIIAANVIHAMLQKR